MDAYLDLRREQLRLRLLRMGTPTPRPILLIPRLEPETIIQIQMEDLIIGLASGSEHAKQHEDGLRGLESVPEHNEPKQDAATAPNTTPTFYLDDLRAFLFEAWTYISRFRNIRLDLKDRLRPGLLEDLETKESSHYTSRQKDLLRVWYAFYRKQLEYGRAIMRVEKLEGYLCAGGLDENHARYARDSIHFERTIAGRIRARLEELERQEPVETGPNGEHPLIVLIAPRP
ncbi:MAG: hypothetical protein Q9203_001320 [Teloschistes exilis]